MKDVIENGGINSISKFIDKVDECIKNRKPSSEVVIVYRGEPKIYPTPGMPGVFRGKLISEKKYFEKNLLDEMKANRITKGKTYLECAVDAQHDEFPSRLLDVTYNALIALYFAVTPYYKRYPEDKYDDKEDSQVIIYYLPKMYCSGAANIDELFKDIIERKQKYLFHSLVQENYKLIDHVKMNTRICVQQGAFIMFQGDAYTPISEKDYDTILIPKSSRKKLREELNDFFGINTGFIYPEPYNLYVTMGEKAYKIDNDNLNIEKEIDCFLARIKGEINYSLIKALQKDIDEKSDIDEKKKAILESTINLEEKLTEYKEELNDFMRDCDKNLEEYYGNDYKDDNVKKYIERFNSLIDEYDERFGMLCRSYDIEMSTNEMKIMEGK